MSSDRSAEASGSEPPVSKKPTVVLVIGMAGSGKTTLMQRLNAHLHQHATPSYILNLDPAVTHVPYDANIDIRDTVSYKDVMQQYQLGPNGGIITSLNLFATKFDQVLTLCDKARTPPLEYILVDTPGQIEIFTWSASGAVISEAFASSFPTVVAYIMDTPRCQNPRTFMSNMLQACSILYKTRLPLLLVFNKVDVAPHDFAVQWMSDFTLYQEALEAEENYAATLSKSLSLVLDEFYTNLDSVGVSAVSGQGIDDFFVAIDKAREEYESTYAPELAERMRVRDERERVRREGEMERVRQDLAAAKVSTTDQGGSIKEK